MISNRITGIVGPKGSGKTFRAAKLFAQEDRAVLYQPVRINTEADIYATHICFDGDIASIFDVINREEKFRIIYKVPDSDYIQRGQNLLYTSILPIATECYNVGNLTLYLDEAHELCNQSTIDPNLRRVLRLARNNRLSVSWVAQSMEVHRELRRGTEEFYFYRIFEPGDLDKIAERCGVQTAERVANLRRLKETADGKIVPGECLYWSAENA